ncbi:LOW QUALITY PROTEIN: protein toll-like [Drosophila tropicalis]|uniref:LOW QUALITY PROTEIN: protein toll-like n=1 Tax=Drosophila tropicalis TaxID=46794 RepID=UPI0035AB8395
MDLIACSTLAELHINNNKLTHLQLDQLPSKIRVIFIRQNKFTGLDDNVTESISKLKIFRVSGNPWQCNCNFSKFLAYLRTYYSTEYKAPNENIGFDQLEELHLRYNRIEEIKVLPQSIQFLDIRNNSLTTLSENLRDFLKQKSNTSNLTVLILGNLWTCKCKEILFFRFTKDLVHNIKDLCKTECRDSRLIVSLEEEDLCPPKIPSYVIFFTSFIMLSCLLSFVQFFWKSIVMWLYEKRLFLRVITRLEKNSDMKYDCFLSHCHNDSHFVKEYVDRLEHEWNRLRLCFYERDWLAGESIPDCICHSVENSTCTLIIMTKSGPLCHIQGSA